MRKSIQAATLVAIFLLGGVALAASFPRWTDNLTIGYSSIFASAPVGTPQPVSGYPVIGTCIRTTIAAVYPIASAGQAHDQSKTGHTRGKIVLEFPS